MTLKLDMQHWVLKYYEVCSNDDPALTYLFYSKVKFGPLCFCMGKKLKQRIFQNLLYSMISKLVDEVN